MLTGDANNDRINILLIENERLLGECERRMGVVTKQYSKLAKVRDLHSEILSEDTSMFGLATNEPWPEYLCKTCWVPYPCETRKLLDEE